MVRAAPSANAVSCKNDCRRARRLRFQPIDLSPDFNPLLGYLNDLIILPMGIWVVLRLIPQPVLAKCRTRGTQWLAERHAKPKSYAGFALVVAI